MAAMIITRRSIGWRVRTREGLDAFRRRLRTTNKKVQALLKACLIPSDVLILLSCEIHVWTLHLDGTIFLAGIVNGMLN